MNCAIYFSPLAVYDYAKAMDADLIQMERVLHLHHEYMGHAFAWEEARIGGKPITYIPIFAPLDFLE